MRGATLLHRIIPRVITFQSTRPMRGATLYHGRAQSHRRVSIHAPHAGRDEHGRRCRGQPGRFNPRAPCGARPKALEKEEEMKMFQSTRPMRGATRCPSSRPSLDRVSIHAPHAGRDPSLSRFAVRRMCFNPRAPCGARHFCTGVRRSSKCFNPRAPCGARRQKKLRLPSFATYLWVLLATNMIFSMSEQHTLLSCAAST